MVMQAPVKYELVKHFRPFPQSVSLAMEFLARRVEQFAMIIEANNYIRHDECGWTSGTVELTNSSGRVLGRASWDLEETKASTKFSVKFEQVL